MLNIRDAAALAHALDSPIDPKLKALLSLRRDQLLTDTDDLDSLVQWIVVEPDDHLAAIEAVAGYPILPDPPWEWVLDHDGLFEAPIILSDDGFCIVLLVPDENGINPTLLTLLRRDVVAAEPSSEAVQTTDD